MIERRVSDHFWSFLMGILVGVPTGVFSGVLLVGSIPMTYVYVVLGECGEYSDRDVWVSGVFLTLPSAKYAVEKATQRRSVYDQWHLKFMSHLGRIRVSWTTATDAEEAEAKRLAGPAPAYEPSERVSIYCVPVEQWGSVEEIEEGGQ